MSRWSSLKVEETSRAGEPALALEDGAAAVVFGRGPAVATADPEHRLARLMTSEGVTAIRWCRQVHGAQLQAITRTDPPRPSCVGEADGLITTLPRMGLVVWTADCVPVVLVADRAVAAVHAGWRGCAAGIVPSAVDRLVEINAGSCDRIRAYLGPAISAANYQVGAEVIAALAATGVSDRSWLDGDRVDLRVFLGAQLRRVGVHRVATVGGCTFADSSLASYRRDGDRAGRQWSLVYLRDV